MSEITESELSRVSFFRTYELFEHESASFDPNVSAYVDKRAGNILQTLFLIRKTYSGPVALRVRRNCDFLEIRNSSADDGERSVQLCNEAHIA